MATVIGTVTGSCRPKRRAKVLGLFVEGALGVGIWEVRFGR